MVDEVDENIKTLLRFASVMVFMDQTNHQICIIYLYTLVGNIITINKYFTFHFFL